MKIIAGITLLIAVRWRLGLQLRQINASSCSSAGYLSRSPEPLLFLSLSIKENILFGLAKTALHAENEELAGGAGLPV